MNWLFDSTHWRVEWVVAAIFIIAVALTIRIAEVSEVAFWGLS